MKLASPVILAMIATAGCAAPVVPPAPAGPLAVREQPESGGARYLGSAACGTCHAAAYARWRASGHAREFSGLPLAERRVSSCLRCHVTGYGELSGYRAGGENPDLANVGCEACHGPGADHGRSAHPGFVPTRTGGDCPPCETNRICRLCHTPERSPTFDMARALGQVRCKP